MAREGFDSKVQHQRVMRSVPPRGSGWVLPKCMKTWRVRMLIADPPATAWWYWPH